MIYLSWIRTRTINKEKVILLEIDNKIINKTVAIIYLKCLVITINNFRIKMLNRTSKYMNLQWGTLLRILIIESLQEGEGKREKTIHQ